MRPRRERLSEAARQAMAFALAAALAACATDELKRAPVSPDQPWTVPEDSDYVKALREAAGEATPRASQQSPDAAAPATPAPAITAQPPAVPPPDERKSDAAPQNRVLLEAGHRYTLPELIDLAERHHPETREAWEKARQAALSVGLAEHTYLPELAIFVLGGYQRTPFPVPQTMAPAGFITFTTAEVVPALTAKWLLFDFGQREAKVREAEAKSFSANVTFTEAHEKTSSP
jgi:hypothetical protein